MLTTKIYKYDRSYQDIFIYLPPILRLMFTVYLYDYTTVPQTNVSLLITVYGGDFSFLTCLTCYWRHQGEGVLIYLPLDNTADDILKYNFTSDIFFIWIKISM